MSTIALIRILATTSTSHSTKTINIITRQHDEQPHSLQQIMSAIARLAVSPRLSMAAARSLRPASVQVIIRMVVVVMGILLVIRMVVVVVVVGIMLGIIMVAIVLLLMMEDGNGNNVGEW